MELKIIEFSGALILLLLGGLAVMFRNRIDAVSEEKQNQIDALNQNGLVYTMEMQEQGKALVAIKTICDLTRQDMLYIRDRIDKIPKMAIIRD